MRGLTIIVLALLVPVFWLPGLAQGRDATALFSQYLGMCALIAMSLAQIIATRLRPVEALFGPLDKSYRLHKWLGIGALVAVLLHDTIDAEMRGLGRETALVEAAETAGEISLYGLIALVLITVATFIPYHLWKWTHRLIGGFFVLGAFHYLLILKPFSNREPLGLYMAAICVLGVLAFVYTAGPRRWKPVYRYRVAGLDATGNAQAVRMEPEGRGLPFRAGQFGFFAFRGAGLTEPHPFTFSAAPGDDGGLRVTIAPLGDFTTRLSRRLEPGQEITVEGPFGRFGQTAAPRQVWIAAGIGITPFLSLAHALPKAGTEVTLIYAVRQADDAAHLDEVRALAATYENLSLIVWESAARGRLDADRLVDLLAGNVAGKTFLFCGPVAMRKALRAGLADHGLAARHFHFEEFEIRTGLGLRRFANWLWARRDRMARLRRA